MDVSSTKSAIRNPRTLNQPNCRLHISQGKPTPTLWERLLAATVLGQSISSSWLESHSHITQALRIGQKKPPIKMNGRGLLGDWDFLRGYSSSLSFTPSITKESATNSQRYFTSRSIISNS